MDQKPPKVLDLAVPSDDGILVPGGQFELDMSVDALVKTAEYIMENHKKFKRGDFFRLTGIDGKKVKMWLK